VAVAVPSARVVVKNRKMEEPPIRLAVVVAGAVVVARAAARAVATARAAATEFEFDLILISNTNQTSEFKLK
jgi:hypothetical protein